jgi:hypothetical protein
LTFAVNVKLNVSNDQQSYGHVLWVNGLQLPIQTRTPAQISNEEPLFSPRNVGEWKESIGLLVTQFLA